MTLRELDVAPHPVTSSPKFGISDFVYRQAGGLNVFRELTVLSNLISAISWYTVAVAYSGCGVHFLTWYFCARKPVVWVHSPQQDCHWWFVNGNITYTCVRTCNKLVLIKRLCSKLEFMHHSPCTCMCNFTLNTNVLHNALSRTDLYLLCFSQAGPSPAGECMMFPETFNDIPYGPQFTADS
jgi:hypothetical protein